MKFDRQLILGSGHIGTRHLREGYRVSEMWEALYGWGAPDLEDVAPGRADRKGRHVSVSGVSALLLVESA